MIFLETQAAVLLRLLFRTSSSGAGADQGFVHQGFLHQGFLHQGFLHQGFLHQGLSAACCPPRLDLYGISVKQVGSGTEIESVGISHRVLLDFTFRVA